MRRADEDAEIISDWKFAAMVVDRYFHHRIGLFILLRQIKKYSCLCLILILCLQKGKMIRFRYGRYLFYTRHKNLQFTIWLPSSSIKRNTISHKFSFRFLFNFRLCLIVFTLFTIIATVTVLLSAPHIIVQ